MRDERLEAALVATPSDPAPCLVYADWLSERGEELLATSYRTLGGEGDGSKPETRWAALMAVAVAAWLLDQAEEDTGDTPPVVAPVLQSGVVEAIEACAAKLSGDARAKVPASLRPWSPPPLISQAVTTLVEATFGLGTTPSFGRAAQLARASVPWADFHRWFAWVLHCAATTKRSPLERDDAFAATMNQPLSDHDLERVEAAPLLPFSFDEVQLTNSTTGVQGRVVMRDARGLTPGRAFATMAVDLAELTEDYETMEPAERRELIDANVLMDEGPTWAASSLFSVVRELLSLQASNDGVPLRTPGHASLIAAVEAYGALEAGASTMSDFPFTLLRFERAFVLLHVVY